MRLILMALAVLLSLSACRNELAPPRYDGYDGAVLYAHNCANCHGVYGEGNGALTPGLAVVVQDLRYLTKRNNGSFPAEFVRKIIDGRATRSAHGPEGMPMWGNVFTSQEGVDRAAQARVRAKIESLVEFVDSMQIDG